jgi:hemerythrin superfamily protein
MSPKRKWIESAPMGDSTEDRAKAANLPDGDLVAILYTQHALVKDLMDQIDSASGDARSQLFTQLTTAVKAHETAEESVVRPVTMEAGADDVAKARNAEEAEASKVIAALEQLDVASDEFDTEFANLKQAVADHAEAEEHEEFPTMQANHSDEQRQMLGKGFLAEFHAAGGKG